MADFKRVAVIGAGVMGAGIAAHLANAGVQVLLLDIVPNDAADRNQIAKDAIAKLLKTNPAPLMHKRFAKNITPGNIADDLPQVKECDWVIEAIIERLDIKQDLYHKIAQYRGKDTIVSSNTSTLPLAALTKGLPEDFTRHFLITHFFNPPRYMRLLELVTSNTTDQNVINRITTFCDEQLGKNVIPCHDTPGFIANRLGTYWLHAATVYALEQKVDVETADAVLGKPTGVPKTGVFGLLDLVGLDLMPHVLSSMRDALPAEDAFQALGPAPALLQDMIEEGFTGRKGKGGFYRLNKAKKKEAKDLQTGLYALAKRPSLEAVKAAKKGGLRALVTHKSPAGEYAWAVLSNTLAYAAHLVGEIADDIEAIDRAMRLGYNWKFGPLELIDQLGTSWFTGQLQAAGKPVPELLKIAAGRPLYQTENGVKYYLGLDGTYHPITRAPGVLLLEDIKRQSTPIAKNISATLWDIGDDVACLEFTSKMNALDPFTLSMMHRALKEIPKRNIKGLVIYNESSNFSVGANIVMLLVTATLRLFPLIRLILRHGQSTFQELKYAPFPVVGAPAGMALGGGCEVLLHCHHLTPHAETYMGLVEAGVGIIPGWGGCKELLARAQAHNKVPHGPMPPVAKSFETIATAQVGKSAFEGRDLLFIRAEDEIIMNRDRVLAAAKQAVLTRAKQHTVPEAPTFNLPGPTGFTALQLAINDFRKKGVATPHDAVVATELARTLSGGKTDMTQELTEADILRLERNAIAKLCGTKGTRARIKHILKTGKPLRN